MASDANFLKSVQQIFNRAFTSSGNAIVTTGGISLNSPYAGRVDLTVSGTAQPVSGSSQAVTGVVIKANSANTGPVWVGPSTVTSGSNGYLMDANDTLAIAIDDLNSVYFDTSSSGEGIFFFGMGS